MMDRQNILEHKALACIAKAWKTRWPQIPILDVDWECKVDGSWDFHFVEGIMPNDDHLHVIFDKRCDNVVEWRIV